jgi:hypothetical protein
MVVVLVVYVPVAVALRGSVTGLAWAFSAAESAGALTALAIAARRIMLGYGALVRRAIAPALGWAATVGLILFGYRRLAQQAPIGWRGIVDVVGGGAVCVAAAIVAMLIAGWPETDKVRAGIRRALAVR